MMNLTWYDAIEGSFVAAAFIFVLYLLLKSNPLVTIGLFLGYFLLLEISKRLPSPTKKENERYEVPN